MARNETGTSSVAHWELLTGARTGQSSYKGEMLWDLGMKSRK